MPDEQKAAFKCPASGTMSGFCIHPAFSLQCKEGLYLLPSAIHESPPARPYLLNDLSIFHVKLDNVHMAEGNDSEGPHDPRAVGIHHLVVDAVTERGKEEQGATASTTGWDPPQGSNTWPPGTWPAVTN